MLALKNLLPAASWETVAHGRAVVVLALAIEFVSGALLLAAPLLSSGSLIIYGWSLLLYGAFLFITFRAMRNKLPCGCMGSDKVASWPEAMRATCNVLIAGGLMSWGTGSGNAAAHWYQALIITVALVFIVCVAPSLMAHVGSLGTGTAQTRVTTDHVPSALGRRTLFQGLAAVIVGSILTFNSQPARAENCHTTIGTVPCDCIISGGDCNRAGCLIVMSNIAALSNP